MAYITGFSCPVSFLTVTQGSTTRCTGWRRTSREAVGTDFQPDFSTCTARILTLPPAVYNAQTLATALQDALNGAGKTIPATYA